MKTAIIFSFLFLSLSAYAEVNLDALSKTQIVIGDSSKREDHIKAMPAPAKQALKILRSMGMNTTQENALFKMAAESFGEILKGANGDTAKMQESLMKSLNNPKKFLESMSETHKNRIRDLSSQVENFNSPEPK